MDIYRNHIRFFPLMAVILGFVVAVPASSQAGEGPWTVQQVAGTARIMTAGGDPVALRTGARLSVGDEVETGADGRLILVRDEESITVSPGSRMSLVEKPENGITTRIVQKLGTLLFKVERRPRRHFEVSTPYLAAVVKGTTFTVSVDSDGAAVHVVEGLVQVADLDTRQGALVRPGQTATTSSTRGQGLSIATGKAPVSGPDKRSDAGPGVGEDAPGQDKAAGPAEGKAKGIVIRNDLADTAVDIPAVTKGLAGSMKSPGSGKAETKAKMVGNGNGSAGVSAQSTNLGESVSVGSATGAERSAVAKSSNKGKGNNK